IARGSSNAASLFTVLRTPEKQKSNLKWKYDGDFITPPPKRMAKHQLIENSFPQLDNL
ncbi:hypothetical protein NPIL_23651, partial [Nephila pilipes]